MATWQETVAGTVAVLLAAGAGSRFIGEGHKLLASLRGEPVFARALRGVRAAGFETVVVVTGALSLQLPADVVEVHNAAWADGQAGSLQAGIDAARRLDAKAVVVGLGDQPFVTPAAWRAVASSDAPIAVASYDGRRGNPVRLAASVWPLLPTKGDQGARALMVRRPDLVSEVPCQGSAADIDTLEDLQRWT